MPFSPPSTFPEKRAGKGRFSPVFTPFWRSCPGLFHSDSTFFGGRFGGGNGRQFSPTSGDGTARKALRIKDLRAEGCQNPWENPGIPVPLQQSAAAGPPGAARMGKSGYMVGTYLWNYLQFYHPKSQVNPGNLGMTVYRILPTLCAENPVIVCVRSSGLFGTSQKSIAQTRAHFKE